MNKEKTILLIFLSLSFSVCTIFGISDYSNPIDLNCQHDQTNSLCKNYCQRGQTCTLPTGTQQTPTCTAVCGDGIIVKGKQDCDDENKINGDGCTNCKIDPLYVCFAEPSYCYNSCGNILYQPQAGEQCDNGNSTIDDGCSNTCQILPHWNCTINVPYLTSYCVYMPYCGDGRVNQNSENCDDGNNVNGDGCSNCKIDPFYLCSGKPSVCKWSCGDKIYQPEVGEQCDNGNSTVDDGCSNNCQILPHWNCSTDYFCKTSTCVYIPYCGDGKINQNSEICDDGNNINSDGCSNSCKVQPFYNCSGQPSACIWRCGNKIYEPQYGEQCDNGNSTSEDGCSNTCKFVTHWNCAVNIANQISVCSYVPYCGDGKINQNIENCDDGNNVNGDGCSNLCKVEPFYLCSAQPSVCKWSCGDSIYQPETGEKCDNGNSTVDDGCSNNCQIQQYWICPTNIQNQLSVCLPNCGDGVIISPFQQCDDKNNINSDGCSNCKVDSKYICSNQPSICHWSCGDNILQSSLGEQCDNGNTTVIDGCSNSCKVDDKWKCTNVENQISVCKLALYCGDGQTSSLIGENCDDGNNLNGDGCSSDCKIQNLYSCTSDPSIPSVCTLTCGNNIYQPLYKQKCDNGNSLLVDGCSNNCQIAPHWDCTNIQNNPSVCSYIPYCGDGFTTTSISQSCDDGNTINGDGCSQNCKIQVSYSCTTDNGLPPASSVPSVCHWSCGDNIYQPQLGEQCDNGNSTQIDGCSNNCKIDLHWSCSPNTVGVPSSCSYVPYCGDGKINQQIQKCDDGNNIDFDGCSSNCTTVQTCITDLEGKKYCYWDCSALFYNKFKYADLPKGQNLLFDTTWCNDYNSRPGDGCTNCQIDKDYSCLQFYNFNQFISLGGKFPQYANYRKSFCTNCVPNIDYNIVSSQQCPKPAQSVCGDNIVSGNQQCDTLFNCNECKFVSNNFINTKNYPSIIQQLNDLNTKVQNQYLNNIAFTTQQAQDLYNRIYDIPEAKTVFSGAKLIYLPYYTTNQQIFPQFLLDHYQYLYYPISKQLNLGFQNFTMSQVKSLFESNNCSISQNPQMFDNIKLFTNLFICTYNLYNIKNGQPNLTYDNSNSLLVTFIQNLLSPVFKKIYQLIAKKQSYQLLSLLSHKQLFQQNIVDKIWETQGITQSQFAYNQLSSVLQTLLQFFNNQNYWSRLI